MKKPSRWPAMLVVLFLGILFALAALTNVETLNGKAGFTPMFLIVLFGLLPLAIVELYVLVSDVFRFKKVLFSKGLRTSLAWHVAGGAASIWVLLCYVVMIYQILFDFPAPVGM